MSEIPKSKRKESKLEVLHKAYQLRARITNELICSFAYSQKKFESHLDKSVRHIRDETEREETKEILRKMEENFDLWVIKREREEILKYTKGIINHIVSANTISPVFMPEFEERRLEMDRAMICCNCLQQELQYIAEILPCDKNKYTSIALETEKIFEMIKKLRQSDNRFLKHIEK